MSATSGMGGGKSANVDLNLVPFIDLFSTLVCFLLMTAAWQELDVMQNATPPKAASEAPADPTQAPPDDKKKIMLTVSLGLQKTDMAEDDKMESIPNLGDAPDAARMATVLNTWKSKYPDRKDVILITDSKAKYKYLIQMMDILITQKFPDVSVNLN